MILLGWSRRNYKKKKEGKQPGCGAFSTDAAFEDIDCTEIPRINLLLESMA